ncbi:MAG: fumarylacetoacetate hydrolase family protein [Pseudomonadota bacterium]
MDETGKTVQALIEARRGTGPYSLPDAMVGASLVEAYALQDAYAAAIAAEAGGIGGYKLAANSAAQMAHFSVAEPVCARIAGGEIHASGATLEAGGFDRVVVEPELAAVLGDGVTAGAPFDRAGTLAAIDRFHAAIELIDFRGRSLPDGTLSEAVALNVYNAGIVLGRAQIAPEALDLPGLHVTLSYDGTQVAEATGNAPQDPIEGVMWLLNHLAGRGIAAQPGMVIMCGTHIPPRPVEADTRRVEISMGPLGEVGFSLG